MLGLVKGIIQPVLRCSRANLAVDNIEGSSNCPAEPLWFHCLPGKAGVTSRMRFFLLGLPLLRNDHRSGPQWF